MKMRYKEGRVAVVVSGEGGEKREKKKIWDKKRMRRTFTFMRSGE